MGLGPKAAQPEVPERVFMGPLGEQHGRESAGPGGWAGPASQLAWAAAPHPAPEFESHPLSHLAEPQSGKGF